MSTIHGFSHPPKTVEIIPIPGSSGKNSPVMVVRATDENPRGDAWKTSHRPLHSSRLELLGDGRIKSGNRSNLPRDSTCRRRSTSQRFAIRCSSGIHHHPRRCLTRFESSSRHLGQCSLWTGIVECRRSRSSQSGRSVHLAWNLHPSDRNGRLLFASTPGNDGLCLEAQL